ncbi:hypothetical protein AX15_002811 [Amanita polypyramis BW_CC]|nr:hypothetical protein AX15_002811 [Amanita polypyramis BW_CC]
MFTSAIAKLPDGIKITYADSGPVQNDPLYTTLVLLHGSTLNSHTFEKVHSSAAKHGLRTVAIQRRHYAGSTRYTEQELDDLKNGRQVFLDRLAASTVHLLKYLVEELKIPKVTHGGKGGIALLGWSMGVSTVMTILDGTKAALPELHEFLTPYLKKIIFLDPPAIAFGTDVPSDSRLCTPWLDLEPSTEDCGAVFLAWVSSYTDVPKFDDWYDTNDINALDGRKRADHASVDSWSVKDFEYMCEPEAAARCENPMFMPPMQACLRETAQRTLFDRAKIYGPLSFPDVPVMHIIAGRSCWQCMWGSYVTKKTYENSLREGKAIREIKFIVMDQANHLVHIDSPDDFLRVIAKDIYQN